MTERDEQPPPPSTAASPKAPTRTPDAPDADTAETAETATGERADAGKEQGGPPGPEPTRFGDWERKGRCIDF